MEDEDTLVDWRLCIEFFDESQDLLGTAAAHLLTLEENPADQPAFDAVFRVFHSIKGNAAFFNMMKVKRLSHNAENLLDLVRKRVLVLDRPLVDLLLRATDHLKEMFGRARMKEPEVGDESGFLLFIEELSDFQQGEIESTETLWKTLRDFVNLVSERPDSIRFDDIEQGTWRQIAEIVGKLAPPGKNAASSATPVVVGGEMGEDPFRSLREILADPCSSVLDKADTDTVGRLLSDLRRLPEAGNHATSIDDIVSDYDACCGTVGLDPLIRELLLDKIEALRKAVRATESVPASMIPDAPTVMASEPESRVPLEPTPRPMPAGKEGTALPSEKTMRVSEECIDNFLEYVGELMIVKEMYEHLYNVRAGAASDADVIRLKRMNVVFSDLVGKLEQTIMDVRKIPLSTLFQRIPKIVRDVATEKNKKIRTRITGEGIRIDKSIIDLLEAPLVHLVRNAADHGIEPPDTRTATGKTETGTVEVSASEKGEWLDILISDDGAGVNFEALRQKGVEAGLFSRDSVPTESEICDILFRSGISTATSVTEISGRGVGMDVVKRNIESAGGTVSIRSEKGKGSTFRVRVPLSIKTQIMAGLTVRVGPDIFVLPMECVLLCHQADTRKMVAAPDLGICFNTGDELIPLVSLADVFLGAAASRQKPVAGKIVVAMTGGRRIALHVDEIDGLANVVVKRIRGLRGAADDLFKGGALMGNGNIALVVDMEMVATSHH
jgi:two-component system chemotaxis sensor kinase CheA